MIISQKKKVLINTSMERIKTETLRCQGKETYSGMRVHSLFCIQKKGGGEKYMQSLLQPLFYDRKTEYHAIT